jgi:hypothetical protein
MESDAARCVQHGGIRRIANGKIFRETEGGMTGALASMTEDEQDVLR